MIFWIIFALVAIVVIVQILKTNKKSKEAQEEAKRVKEEEISRMREKIKSTEATLRWATEISDFISTYISSNKNYDIEFQFMAYCQDFEFGVHLELVMKNSSTIVNQRERRTFLCYNFASFGLPELGHGQLEQFAFLFAEVVREMLLERGITTSIGKSPRFFGYDDNHEYIPELIYKHPKYEGEW